MGFGTASTFQKVCKRELSSTSGLALAATALEICKDFARDLKLKDIVRIYPRVVFRPTGPLNLPLTTPIWTIRLNKSTTKSKSMEVSEVQFRSARGSPFKWLQSRLELLYLGL